MNNDSLIDKIIDEVDIVEFIGRDIELEKRGSNYVGLCPFHEDSSPSYTVNREKKYSKCFACNTGGNVITYYQKRHNVSFKEALRVLAKEIGIELSQEKIELTNMHRINTSVKKYYEIVLQLDQTGKLARDYLETRKISEELIELFHLGYAPSNRENILKYLGEINNGEFINELGFKYPKGTDFFKDRLMIPVLDDLGRCVGFSGRTLVNEEIKYLNSREDETFQKRNILYNLNNAKRFSTDELYIAEGFFDVIALAKMQIKNAVALMGTSFTKEHIDLIKKYKYKAITFILDQDDAGQQATIKAANALVKTGMTNIKVINFDNYKDVDELITNETFEYAKQIIETKQDYFQFRINYLKQIYNLDDIDEKTKFLRQSIEDLNRLSTEKVANIIQYLAKLTGLEQNIIQSMVYKGPQQSQQNKVIVQNNKKNSNMPTDDDAVIKFALVSKTNYDLAKVAVVNGNYKFRDYQELFDVLGNYYQVYDEYDMINMMDFAKGNEEFTDEFRRISEKKYIDLNKVPQILSGQRSKIPSGLFTKRRR